MNIGILFYRHIFKSKNDDDDDKSPGYYRLKEEKQYSDLQVS